MEYINIELFGKTIKIDNDCVGVASAMFQVYLKTHLKINDDHSFNLLCLDDPEMIDTYNFVTGKGIKETMIKYKSIILKHKFPIITKNNIYK